MNREEKAIKELLKKYLEEKPNSQCPDEITLSLFIEKKLSPEEEKKVINHLITCEDCRKVVVKASHLTQEEDKKIITFKERKKRNLKKFFIPISLAASVLLAFILYTEYGVNKKEEIYLPKGKHIEEKKNFPEKVKEEIEKIIKKIKKVFNNED